MNIQYDHKTQGLLVDVSDEEIQDMAKLVCTKAEHLELLENEIGYIKYGPIFPEEIEYKRSLWGLGLMLVLWPLTLAVLICGLYQIFRWLISWMN